MIRLFKLENKVQKAINGKVKIFGENFKVKVIYSKVKNTELDLEDKNINIYIPNKFKKINNINIIRLALNKMYDEIARIEIEQVMEETRIMLNGLAPEYYEIRRIPNKLAKCSIDKVITINPEIIKYDKNVLRYVVLHEFCHLKYKTHSKGFFKMIEEHMPEYREFTYFIDAA